jgi:DNA polymerase/3'-5' exonuclease PolX
MNLAQAQHYATKIVNWLMPYCAEGPTFLSGISIVIAGSIRRQRPECADVDIVCIPKIEEVKDMLQTVISRKNLLAEFLVSYVGGVPSPGAKILTNGPRQLLIDLPKCQLDLWFADENNFASRLLCRTGSKDHNIWLATRAKRQGKHWKPYEGIEYGGRWIAMESGDVYAGGHLLEFKSEADIYASLDLPFIEPKNRELDYLVKNFGQ